MKSFKTNNIIICRLSTSPRHRDVLQYSLLPVFFQHHNLGTEGWTVNIFHIWSALNWWHCTWQASSAVVVTTLCSLRICSILPQLKVWRERRVTQDMFDFSLIFLSIESSIHCLLSWIKVCFSFSVSPVPPFLLPRIQQQQGPCSPACPPQANWFLVSWVAGDCGTVWQCSRRGLCSILSRGSPEIFKVAGRNDVKIEKRPKCLIEFIATIHCQAW